MLLFVFGFESPHFRTAMTRLVLGPKLDKDPSPYPAYRKLNRSRSVQSRRSSGLSAYDPMPTIAEETESQLIDALASRKSTAYQLLPISTTECFIAELKFVSSIDVVV